MASAESPDKPKDLRLKELLAAASHDYALKSYDNASDLYAQAAELQDEINGEMNPANAELLYAYGRCLHHLAVSNSDVLGGKVAGPPDGAKKSGKKRKRGGDAVAGSSSAAASGIASDTMKRKEGALAEDILERIVEEREGMQFKEEEEKVKQQSKPLFQISGDDDGEQDEGTDSEDDEADEDAGDDEAEEQEDDFATAFEVLEVARVLLQRQIQDLNALKSTDKANQNTDDEVSKQIWAARDRLADAHDLQAEISLENERFADAVSDSRASLTLKQELHEETNGQIAEAHYKLSLALECGSVTIPKDENGMPIEGAPQKVDKAMREEAAKEMEAAIRTTRLRLDKETEAMKALSGAQLKTKQEEKKDVEEIIGDMEIKLEDLRSPFVSVNNPSGPAGAALDNNPLGGILGQMLGESPQALKARIEEATKGANDLSGMIKHKKKPEAELAASASVNSNENGKGKRKIEDEGSEDELASDSKRSKSVSK